MYNVTYQCANKRRWVIGRASSQISVVALILLKLQEHAKKICGNPSISLTPGGCRHRRPFLSLFRSRCTQPEESPLPPRTRAPGAGAGGGRGGGAARPRGPRRRRRP